MTVTFTNYNLHTGGESGGPRRRYLGRDWDADLGATTMRATHEIVNMTESSSKMTVTRWKGTYLVSHATFRDCEPNQFFKLDCSICNIDVD